MLKFTFLELYYNEIFAELRHLASANYFNFFFFDNRWKSWERDGR